MQSNPGMKGISQETRKRFNEAQSLMRTGHLDEAMSLFDAITQRHPSHGGALLAMSAIHLRNDDYAKAEETLKKAMRNEGSRAVAQSMMARVAQNTGKLKEAIAWYEEAIAADPSRIKARLALSQLYMRAEAYPEATETLRDALRFNPQSVAAATLMARALSEQGRYEEATKLLEEMAIRVPDSADIQVSLGRIALRANRYEDAAAAMNHAVSLAPEDARMRALQGRVLAQCGHEKAAIHAFEQALEFDSGLHVAKLILARLLIKHERLEQARQLLHVLSTGPRSITGVHFMLGELYCKQQQWTLAVAEFESGLAHARDGLKKKHPDLYAIAANADDAETKAKAFQAATAKMRFDQEEDDLSDTNEMDLDEDI